jgi:perosamine synthetase
MLTYSIGNKIIYKLLKSKEQYTGGGVVAEFEKMLEEYYGKKYCLACSSATNAMTILIKELELIDSEVITSPFNWPSSLGGLLLFNNRVIFSDTKDDLTIDVKNIEKKITRRTKAILAVDFTGNPSDTIALRKICNKYNLFYIADAAQSLFARTKENLPASALADFVIISFTSGKSLSLGEGGAILTNNKNVYQKLLKYTHPYRYKIEVGLEEYNEFIPINNRINPLTAQLGLENFNKSEIMAIKHSQMIDNLLEELQRVGLIKKPSINGLSTFNSTFFYPIDSPKRTLEKFLGERSFKISLSNTFQLLYKKMIPPEIKNLFRATNCLNAESYQRQLRMFIPLKNKA